MKSGLDLDFVLKICQEMIPGRGEDSYCHCFRDDAGLIAVFDGCGGAGARTHDYYSGRTEAYMASRICAGAFYDIFRAAAPDALPDARMLTDAALTQLKKFAPPVEPGAFVMKGSMVRTLPTTVAAAIVRQSHRKGLLSVDAIWAGDSRVYLLDENGLAQLTADDTSVPNPMQNLYDDGVLKNILCSDREVTVHCTTVDVEPPFMVLTATDGCFGYVSTPMEFEALLLRSLMGSQCPEQWEASLTQAMGALAGDDYSLCLAAFGYHQFESLRNALRDRCQWMETQYLEPLSKLPLEDRNSREILWQQYRRDYFRWMKEGHS